MIEAAVDPSLKQPSVILEARSWSRLEISESAFISAVMETSWKALLKSTTELRLELVVIGATAMSAFCKEIGEYIIMWCIGLQLSLVHVEVFKFDIYLCWLWEYYTQTLFYNYWLDKATKLYKIHQMDTEKFVERSNHITQCILRLRTPDKFLNHFIRVLILMLLIDLRNIDLPLAILLVTIYYGKESCI